MTKREEVEKYPFLVRYVDSGIYYLRTTINGRLVEKSTGEKKLSGALTRAKRLMSEEGGDARRIGTVTYQDLRDELLKIQGNKAPATLASAKFQLAKLDRFFTGWTADRLTESAWEDYMVFSRRIEPGRQLEHDRRHFVMLCNLAYRKGLLSKPVRVRKIQSDGSPGRALEPDEVARLLETAQACGADLHLQVMMALTMGMRKSEILKLSWDRVNLGRGLITLRAQDTKIRKGRVFGISDPVLEALRRRTPKGPFVFPNRLTPSRPQANLEKLWDECRSLAKVKCRFHDLRHTFLTRAFKESVNPALICHYAGLSLEEAQKTYLHISAEDTRIVSQIVWGNMGSGK